MSKCGNCGTESKYSIHFNSSSNVITLILLLFDFGLLFPSLSAQSAELNVHDTSFWGNGTCVLRCRRYGHCHGQNPTDVWMAAIKVAMAVEVGVA